MNNLLTVQEVAEILHLSTSTIYKYAETGKLPSILIGTNRRFFADAIESFLQNSTIETTQTLKEGDK